MYGDDLGGKVNIFGCDNISHCGGGTPCVCGGRHWLAHPPGQDILSSIHHNLINSEIAVASVSGNCKVMSV